MCLWLDLTNPQAEVSKKEILLLTQCVLVLLGSASNAVNLERRNIAFARINPNLKTLATEQYEKREDQLFGPGKASKKLETQRALANVSTEQASRKQAWNDDKINLHCIFFLTKGASVKYGSRTQGHTKPYGSRTQGHTKPYYRPYQQTAEIKRSKHMQPNPSQTLQVTSLGSSMSTTMLPPVAEWSTDCTAGNK